MEPAAPPLGGLAAPPVLAPALAAGSGLSRSPRTIAFSQPKSSNQAATTGAREQSMSALVER
jgi:hypothetical protein